MVKYKSIAPGSKEDKAFVNHINDRTGSLVNTLLLTQLNEDEVEEVFNAFHNDLGEKYNELSKIQTQHPQSKSWWDNKCQQAADLHKQDQTRDTKRNLHRVTRLTKRKYYDSIVERLGETRRPWDALTWIGARSQPKRVSNFQKLDGSVAEVTGRFEILHCH
jgi:hypothetical protein